MNAGLPAGGTHTEPGEFHFPGPDVPGGGIGGAASPGQQRLDADLIAGPAGVPRARAMLQRAEWAARAFAHYDKQAVDRVVHAAAQAGAARAREYAEWAVREIGRASCRERVYSGV